VVRSVLVTLALASTAVLVLADSASSLQKPGRTQVRAGRITQIALTHASIAFAVGETPAQCDHVELWNPDVKGTWRFGASEPCKEQPSTGSGVSAVGVATSRVLWISFAGGNIRDWSLWTATTTRKTPRRIRLLSVDVDAPSPFVLGEGTPGAVPYAVRRRVVYLGDNGKAVFKRQMAADVLALAAGQGPGGAQVAVLLATGPVLLLSNEGAVVRTYPYAAGAVRAIRLAPRGLVAQVGNTVEIRRFGAVRTIPLPAAARMIDYAEGGILYKRAGETHLLGVGSLRDTLLLRDSPGAPALPQYDTHGLAWARRNTVNWVCAGCIG
jgi:hypothetical protein